MATREMITEPQDFFDKGCGRCDRFDTADLLDEAVACRIAALRAICLDAGLEETAKWGHPATCAGIAISR